MQKVCKSGDLMRYLCTYSECLQRESVSVECHRHLSENHKHNQQNHIIPIEKINEAFLENSILINSRLELEQNQIISYSVKIQSHFSTIKTGFLGILKKIENILLSQLQQNVIKIENAKLRLQQIMDDESENQWKEKASVAVQSKDNILPNMHILQIDVNGIQSLLEEILSTIVQCDSQVANLEKDNQSDNQKIEFYCFDKNDKEKSYIQSELKQNQNKIHREWSNFYKDQTKILTDELNKSIRSQIETTFTSLMSEATYPQVSSIIQKNITEHQIKIQGELKKKFNSLIISCCLLNQDFNYKKIYKDINKTSFRKIKNLKIPSKFIKAQLSSQIKKNIQYIFAFSNQLYEESQNFDIIEFEYEFRLKYEHFQGLQEGNSKEPMIFGTEGNFIKFKYNTLYYGLDEIVWNGTQQNREQEKFKHWYLCEETSLQI